MAGNQEVTAELTYSQRYYLENKEACLEKDRRRRLANPEEAKLRMRAWRARNREKVREDNRERQRIRRQNPAYRLNHSISCGVYQCLSGKKNSRSWQNLVGYTKLELVQYLESKFTEGMTWDNYGQWHVDHVRPLVSFTITGPDCPEFKDAWSLNNLQPLWAEDNMKKGAKY